MNRLDPQTRSRRALGLRDDLVMTVLFAAALWAGRLTRPPGGSMALLMPAAGVALVWCYAPARRRWRGSARPIALLWVSSVVVNVATGAPLVLAAAYGVANVLTGAVAAEILARPDPAGTRRIESPRRFFVLCLAALAGAVASAPIGVGAAMLVEGDPVSGFGLWILRNVVSAVIVGIIAFRMLRRGPRVLPPSPRNLALAGAAFTALSYWVVFCYSAQLLLFLLVPVTLYTALRADVRVTIGHTLAVSALTIGSAYVGVGAFGAVDRTGRAVIAQAFVLVLVFIAMTTVLDREERARLQVTLEAHRLATQEQAILLERVVTSVAEGVLLVDPDGQVGLGNPAAERLLGLATPYLGRAVLPPQLFDPTGATPAPVNEVFRVGGGVSGDITVETGGAARRLAVSVVPLVMAEGNQSVAILRDVTEERRRTAELANFAGVVAHDLRNPLTALRGWLDVLGEEVTQPEPAAVVRRIEGCADRMRVLIEDLLSYSVVRGGELAPVVYHLTELVGDIVDAYRERLVDGRPPRITVDLDAWVRVDRIAVRQVVSNLLGNAVKYAPRGHAPDIELRLGGEVGGLRHVIVADRGIGLPPGQEAKIFEEFHRVEGHKAQYAGTGLGLAICRRVVERHGGTIRATNRAGGGLEVDFTVPAAEPTPADLVAYATWCQARAGRAAALGALPAAPASAG